MRPQLYMTSFRNCLDDCGLDDLGYIGDSFTWKRGMVRERLDRALRNVAWSAMFLDSGVHNLAMGGSDHRPILVDTSTYSVKENSKTRRRRFEARWLREEGLGELVTTAWYHSPPSVPVIDKLASVHQELHEWDKNVLKAPRKKSESLRQNSTTS